jgi:hypothetical protein
MRVFGSGTTYLLPARLTIDSSFILLLLYSAKDLLRGLLTDQKALGFVGFIKRENGVTKFSLYKIKKHGRPTVQFIRGLFR